MTKKKQNKPVVLDMSFDEAIRRLSNVDKTKVEVNIKKGQKKKDNLKNPNLR